MNRYRATLHRKDGSIAMSGEFTNKRAAYKAARHGLCTAYPHSEVKRLTVVPGDELPGEEDLVYFDLERAIYQGLDSGYYLDKVITTKWEE